jgi:adenylate cyclase
MNSSGVRRKLSAILSADVKGYSRLMADDEAGTVETLKQYREVLASLIQAQHGRVVDDIGDNLLAEFTSVIDATQCAAAIQDALEELNAQLADHRKMEFRIGINLGDVIEDGDRIYGDGINIAARVQGLAEAGGVYISGTVYDQVRNKLRMLASRLSKISKNRLEFIASSGAKKNLLPNPGKVKPSQDHYFSGLLKAPFTGICCLPV